MGVKSTKTLTRTQAIYYAVDLHTRAIRREVEAIYTAMQDKELEDVLEEMNDDLNGGEGFENYSIHGE